MKLIRLLSLIVLCVACKKDNQSYEELYKKADEKLVEIEKLVKTSSCNDLSSLQIDSVIGGYNGGYNSGYKYFPVGNEIKNAYSKLKSEYMSLLEAARKMDERPILNMFVEPESHFGIGCIDGSPKVLLASDFNLEQTREKLNTSIRALETFYANPICDNPSNWYALPITKDCKLKYVLFQNDSNSKSVKDFNAIYRQHKALSRRLAKLDPSYVKCENLLASPKGVRCENNRPVIEE